MNKPKNYIISEEDIYLLLFKIAIYVYFGNKDWGGYIKELVSQAKEYKESE